MRVRWRLTKARHAVISFEVVEWSEQLRSVISAWLGAVRCSVQVRLCTSGCKSENMFGIITIIIIFLFVLSIIQHSTIRSHQSLNSHLVVSEASK